MKRSSENPQHNKESIEEQGGFLNRWSQRKRQATDPADNPQLDELLTDDLAQQLSSDGIVAEELSELADSSNVETPVLTDVDMPDLETLNADSDFSPFFSEGVSKELRNQALKKLFFSGKFSARDGLDDYDDDFTYFEPLGDTVTSDMKFHQRRKEKARIAELEAQEKLEAEEKLAAQAELEEQPQEEHEESADTVHEGANEGVDELGTEEQGTEEQAIEAPDTAEITHAGAEIDNLSQDSAIDNSSRKPLG